MVRHLLSYYATYDVITKSNDDIRDIKQGLLALSNCSKTIWDLTLRSGDNYDEQMLFAIFVHFTDVSIHSTMRRFWANSREATLNDLE